MHDDVARLLRDQAGVLSRSQALAAGLGVVEVRRLVRRREWVAIHPGVYVDHTGPPSWSQRAWAGVLATWPAALSHQSAIWAGEGPSRRHGDAVVHVAVARHRRPVAPAGVRVHRLARLDDRVQWHLGPPRVRLEEALLDVADESPTDLEAIALLADACGSRRTTALRLVDVLAARPRAHRRSWLTAVLRDVADGTCSVLEHAYLTRVERPHGLPVGRRQALRTGATRPMFQDVAYDGLGLVVELDGRLHHDSAVARDRDLERDLDHVVRGGATVRLGWGQVVHRPCRTAGQLAVVLGARGWTGRLRPCPECGGSGQPG